MPTRNQRGTRSASQPNRGAITMYETMKAVAKAPILASAPSVPLSGDRVFREKLILDSRLHRRQHLPINVIEQVDA